MADQFVVSDVALKAGEPWGYALVIATLTDLNGNPVTNGHLTDQPGTPVQSHRIHADPVDGEFALHLYANADITPANTYYTVSIGGGGYLIDVTGNGSLASLEATSPGELEEGAASTAALAAEVAARIAGDENLQDQIDGIDTGSVTAADVESTPFGTIAATNVQDALEEVYGEATGGGGGAVDSVNGETGAVVLDAADVDALPITGGDVTGPTSITATHPDLSETELRVESDVVAFDVRHQVGFDAYAEDATHGGWDLFSFLVRAFANDLDTAKALHLEVFNSHPAAIAFEFVANGQDHALVVKDGAATVFTVDPAGAIVDGALNVTGPTTIRIEPDPPGQDTLLEISEDLVVFNIRESIGFDAYALSPTTGGFDLYSPLTTINGSDTDTDKALRFRVQFASPAATAFEFEANGQDHALTVKDGATTLFVVDPDGTTVEGALTVEGSAGIAITDDAHPNRTTALYTGGMEFQTDYAGGAAYWFLHDGVSFKLRFAQNGDGSQHFHDATGTEQAVLALNAGALAIDGEPIATEAFAEALFAANDALLYKGVIDCSGNPNYPAASQGHVYKVSVAGKIGGASGVNVQAGDTLLCTTDTAAGTQAAVGANWGVIQANIDGAVIGPASAVTDRVATFDGTTGKLIKDGGSTVADLTVPAASTTVAGKVELANDAETITGTDVDRAVTPASLAAATQDVADLDSVGTITGATEILAAAADVLGVTTATLLADFLATDFGSRTVLANILRAGSIKAYDPAHTNYGSFEVVPQTGADVASAAIKARSTYTNFVAGLLSAPGFGLPPGLYVRSDGTDAFSDVSFTGQSFGWSVTTGKQIRIDSDPSNANDLSRKSYVDGRTPAATTAVSGLSELANSAETITGTDTARVVTPSGLTAAHVAYRTITSPTSTVSETMPRWAAGGALAAVTSGTVYAILLELEAGQTVTNLTWVSRTTGITGATNQWAGLMNTSRSVLAVSADGTSGAWTASTAKTYALGTPYPVTTSGVYYAFLMVAAATPPQLHGFVNTARAVNDLAPVYAGFSSTGQTTPIGSGDVGRADQFRLSGLRLRTGDMKRGPLGLKVHDFADLAPWAHSWDAADPELETYSDTGTAWSISAATRVALVPDRSGDSPMFKDTGTHSDVTLAFGFPDAPFPGCLWDPSDDRFAGRPSWYSDRVRPPPTTFGHSLLSPNDYGEAYWFNFPQPWWAAIVVAAVYTGNEGVLIDGDPGMTTMTPNPTVNIQTWNAISSAGPSIDSGVTPVAGEAMCIIWSVNDTSSFLEVTRLVGDTPTTTRVTGSQGNETPLTALTCGWTHSNYMTAIGFAAGPPDETDVDRVRAWGAGIIRTAG